MPVCHRGSFGFVYVASTPDRGEGPIKVGFTQDLDRRLRQIRGTLIASAPGSFVQEQHLVQLCREHRSRKHWQAREWFTESVFDVLAPAWERMFGVTLPAEVPA